MFLYNITHVLFAGGVKRPSLMDIKPDIAATKLLGRILKCKFLGDDQLLREIIKYFEEHGLKVLSSKDIINNTLPLGAITKIGQECCRKVIQWGKEWEVLG